MAPPRKAMRQIHGSGEKCFLDYTSRRLALNGQRDNTRIADQSADQQFIKYVVTEPSNAYKAREFI